jgi:hypothetical protein
MLAIFSRITLPGLGSCDPDVESASDAAASLDALLDHRVATFFIRKETARIESNQFVASKLQPFRNG